MGRRSIDFKKDQLDAELERLWKRLQPLVVNKMPLDEPPPRSTRFGSPLVLSRVHWVRPEMVAEVSYVDPQSPDEAAFFKRPRGNSGLRFSELWGIERGRDGGPGG